jgi:pilus assembly protein CpaB
MSPRTILVLMLALVSGISAVVGVRSIIGNTERAPRAETVKVVVASQELPPGEVIPRTSLRTRDYPKDSAPAGVISNIEQAAERVATMPIALDDMVLESKLAPKGVGSGIAPLIPIGMRAVCIQIANVAAGHAGLLMPKNRVDVLFTSTDQGTDDQTGGGSTTNLLQNVEILAVDRKIYITGDNKAESSELRSVTLVVTPDQANKLDLAQNKGTLHLSLRNPKDDKTAESPPALLADIRFHQEKPVPVPSPAQTVLPEPTQAPVIEMRIRTLRGRNTGTISLPAP